MMLAVDGFGPVNGWLAFAVVLILICAAGAIAVVQRATDEKKRAGSDR